MLVAWLADQRNKAPLQRSCDLPASNWPALCFNIGVSGLLFTSRNKTLLLLFLSWSGPGVALLPTASSHLLRRAEEEHALFLHGRLTPTQRRFHPFPPNTAIDFLYRIPASQETPDGQTAASFLSSSHVRRESVCAERDAATPPLPGRRAGDGKGRRLLNLHLSNLSLRNVWPPSSVTPVQEMCPDSSLSLF